jgi:hypothetical protein
MSEFGEVEWVEAPMELDRADRVAKELQTKPDQWGRIAKNQPALTLILPWWAKLRDHPDYEIRSLSSGQGKKDIYARYVGKVKRSGYEGV